MEVTVNLRNNTDWWIQVDGIEETIAPNTPLDDRTYQWISSQDKEIKFFDNIDCQGTPVLISTLKFQENVGIKVCRGELSGAQVVKLDVDTKGGRVVQEDNRPEELLLEWGQIGTECVINFNFNK